MNRGNKTNNSIFFDMIAPIKRIPYALFPRTTNVTNASKKDVIFPDRVDKKFIIIYWTTIFGKNTWGLHERVFNIYIYIYIYIYHALLLYYFIGIINYNTK